MSNTDVTKAQTFEERMVGRVRDSIGDMMTDDELKVVVERAVQRIFFQDKLGSGYNREPIAGSSLAHKMVADLMKPMVEKAMNKWAGAPHGAPTQLLDWLLHYDRVCSVAHPDYSLHSVTRRLLRIL